MSKHVFESKHYPSETTSEVELHATTLSSKPQIGAMFSGGSKGMVTSGVRSWLGLDVHLPTVTEYPLTQIYDILGKLLGITDYEENLANFWFLDIFADALYLAQETLDVAPNHQRVMAAWLGHILNLIRENKWSREEAFHNLQDTIILAGKQLMHFGWEIPSGGSNEAKRSSSYQHMGKGPTAIEATKSVIEATKNIKDMNNIVEILYNVFANAFQYQLILYSFAENILIEKVPYPYEINFPRSYKPQAILKQKGKEKAGKNEKGRSGSKRRKGSKGGSKKKKKGKSKDKKRSTATTVESRSDSEYTLCTSSEFGDHKENEGESPEIKYILPLQDAVDEEFFKSIFPEEIKEKQKRVTEDSGHKESKSKEKKKDKKKSKGGKKKQK